MSSNEVKRREPASLLEKNLEEKIHNEIPLKNEGPIGHIPKEVKKGVSALSALLVASGVGLSALKTAYAQQPFKANIESTLTTQREDPSVTLDDILNNASVNVGDPSKFTFDNIENNLPDAITQRTVTEEQTIDTKVKLWIGKNTYELSKINETTGETIIPDQMKQMDVAPYIDPKANRTLIPIRFVAEALGAQVGWDGANRIVSITLGDKTIQVPVPKYDKNGNPINPEKYKYYIVNGVKESMDTYAQIENSRTFLPLRFVLEALGADVSWNGKERSITVTLDQLQEIQNLVKEINWSYKVNGVSLEERKNLYMPLNKSVSSLMSDKDLAEYLEEKGLTLTSETKNGLPILADALLNLNPKVSDNILKGISDSSVLGYLASYDGKESVSGKNDLINLLNKNISELNSKYSMKSALTIIKGVLKASDLGYVKPLKTYEEVLTVSESLKEMMDNRLYKEDDKGGKITLEDLIDEDRVMTFAALNSLHNDVKANLLLSQSRELAELTKKGELSQVKDFLDVIYSAMNSTVNIEGEDVKEEDTVPFKQMIEQLDPADWEMNNKADFLLNTYNKLKEMNISVKNNPKLFFALSLYRSLLANNYKTVSDSDKEKITEMLTTSAARTFEYLTKVQKFREAINSKDMKTIDNLLNNYFGFQNQSKQDQEAIMKGIEFMIKEGVSDIDYQKFTTLTNLQIFGLQYNDIEQIHEALQKGISLYQALQNQLAFSDEQMTDLVKTLFLRELTVSGHTLKDILPPKDAGDVESTLWQIIKNPNQKLNILNLDESKGAPASAIVSQMLERGLFNLLSGKASLGQFPNGQNLIISSSLINIKDWPAGQKNLKDILTILTGPLTSYATSKEENLLKLSPPYAFGIDKLRSLLENITGVPSMNIYGYVPKSINRKIFNSFSLVFTGKNYLLEEDIGNQAEFFYSSSSDYSVYNKKISAVIKGKNIFNSKYSQTDFVENSLYFDQIYPFSKYVLMKVPDTFLKNELKLTEPRVFYELVSPVPYQNKN